MRFRPARQAAAARAGSDLNAVHGAAICKYSLPATQTLRNSAQALRNSMASSAAAYAAIFASRSAISLASAAASLIAIWRELGTAKGLEGVAAQALVALAFGTVALSWLFTHLIFATHYAHEYYAPDEDDCERAGLLFPAHREEEKPDFWDFVHFALVIGVANQTADVQIRSRGIRRIVTIHGIVAFLFNTVILAISINFAASLFEG